MAREEDGKRGKGAEGADILGAEGMKGGLVQGERKRQRGGTREAREMHFRQHEGEREAEGSVLPLTLQTHSSMHRDITLRVQGDSCRYYTNKPREVRELTQREHESCTSESDTIKGQIR